MQWDLSALRLNLIPCLFLLDKTKKQFNQLFALTNTIFALVTAFTIMTYC